MMSASLQRKIINCLVLAVSLLFLALCCHAADANEASFDRSGNGENKVQWRSLIGNTMTFLAVQHSFRLAAEPYTREATMTGPYLEGVGSAFNGLHGWSDGDGFLTNYIGHPMEGAIAGFIFSHNDPKYRAEEFGSNRDYWRGKTRAFAFSALYSLQFEIGPFSEATIGEMQAYWPKQGLVDWVISPTVGFAWTLAEDSFDKYAVKNLERRTRNPYFRALIRSGLNPSRSLANMIMLKYPWHRDSRPGVRECVPTIEDKCTPSRYLLPFPLDSSDPYGRKHASFSFDVPFEVAKYGGLSCIGGGTTIQLGLNQSWDVVFDLSGCKLVGLPDDYSGDSLSYMLGARWSPKNAKRIVPSIRMMIGGQKIYEEHLADNTEGLQDKSTEETSYRDTCPDCTQSWRKNGLAVSIGAGFDLGINRALGIRLASIDYVHSWIGSLNGVAFDNGVRFSSGLAVNIGGW